MSTGSLRLSRAAATLVVLLVMCVPGGTAVAARADDSGDLPVARAGHDEPNGVSVGSIDPRTALDIRALYGPPDAFAVLYFDEQGADGMVATVSMSRWSYYDEGVEFSFAGDEVVAEDPVFLEPGSTSEPVPYDPDQFRAYMNLDEVVAAAGLEDYLGGPVDELVDGGELYFADRLSWGLQDGELRYIEAFALEAEVATGASE